MRFRLPLLLMLLSAACLYGCNFTDKNHPAYQKEVLGSQPFAPLTDSIRQFPERARLYLERAALLTQQNFHQLACNDYKRAWKIQPDEATALAYTSSLLLCGQEAAAIDLLQQGMRLFPDSREFSRRLTETYVLKGDLNKALDQYSLTLQKDSLNFDAWYQKGVLLVRRKDTAAAIGCFEKAYKLQPLQLYGISLAYLYAQTGNPKAAPVCDRLIGQDSSQRATELMFIKGVYFDHTHRYEQALQQYETCIRKDWKFTEAYIKKGIILFNYQNIDEALNTFAIAAKISVTYADAYYWMGRCYEKIGKTQDARDSYERALALNRNYPDAEAGLRRIR